MNIFATLRNAWKTDEIRTKIIFTFFIILLFRIGSSIPVPFINAEAIAAYFDPTAGSAATSLFGYFNMLSGNALSAGVVFALTIQPYINASIIIQLLTIAIPALERLQKEGGEEGKKTLNKLTRWLSIAIAVIQGIGYYTILANAATGNYTNALADGYALSDGFPGWVAAITIVVTLVAGACVVMWLGESIDKKGIGNGISMILFASIVARGSTLITSGAAIATYGYWWIDVIVAVLFLAMLGFIVYMDSAERRIPIQYAKRQVGRKMYGGQSTFLPIKVAMTGVMPIIFTFAIIGVPSTIAQFLSTDNGFRKWVETYFNQTSPLYIILTFVLIIAFNYFYIAIQYNPVEIANNIKSNGGTIPGIRPGKPTSDFIIKSVNKITLLGAFFLGIIAILPFITQLIFTAVVGADSAVSGFISGIALGGTSVLILVSVSIETVRQLESQMLMRHYKGFLD